MPDPRQGSSCPGLRGHEDCDACPRNHVTERLVVAGRAVAHSPQPQLPALSCSFPPGVTQAEEHCLR